jgi:hypothetical protein
MGKKPWDDIKEKREKRWFIIISASCLISLFIMILAGNFLASPLKEIIILLAWGAHMWLSFGYPRP